MTFYCGDNFDDWGPRSVETGIGGSEEAVICMARELAVLGCDVSVYCRLSPDSPERDRGVRWLPFQSFSDDEPGDVFIAWRRPEYLERGRKWRQRHQWLHDRWDFIYPDDAAAAVDRVLLVSHDQGTDPGLGRVPREKMHFTTNGIAAEFLRDPGANEPERAIYASCPARGLIDVLEMWPDIRRAVPAARLDVYYGFNGAYQAMADLYPFLDVIREKVMRLVEQPGVTYHGRVGHHELADAFARSGLWIYPTECPETSCITAMKALAMGCLPITSGRGALAETLDGHDLGPVDPKRAITKSRWRMWRFRRAVIRTMRNGRRPELMRKRFEWARWARERYAWSRVAREWLELFARVEREKAGA